MKRIIVTTGEPAGIGPDVVLEAAQKKWEQQIVTVGDRGLLEDRAAQLGLTITFLPFNTIDPPCAHTPGVLSLIDIPLNVPCRAGQLNSGNASYVMAQLEIAAESCLRGDFTAMVTAPVHKSVINAAGIPFSGHTEFIGEMSGNSKPVMLLIAQNLRVAIATTHHPLRAVPNLIDSRLIQETLEVLHRDLEKRFDISNPRLTVLGLNPHAGEGGYMGHEEIQEIAPACDAVRKKGCDVMGPISADTAFTPDIRSKTDAYLAMYHDQGLPVLKALGFEAATNVTLGLPFVRTSVDHGTAIDLAGTGLAKASSMETAIKTAFNLK